MWALSFRWPLCYPSGDPCVIIDVYTCAILNVTLVLSCMYTLVLVFMYALVLSFMWPLYYPSGDPCTILHVTLVLSCMYTLVLVFMHTLVLSFMWLFWPSLSMHSTHTSYFSSSASVRTPKLISRGSSCTICCKLNIFKPNYLSRFHYVLHKHYTSMQLGWTISLVIN